MSDTPLIYTIKGNLPVENLRYEPHWEDTEDYIKFVETYYLGDEVVKQSAHVYSKRGVSSAALLQPLV